MTRSLRSASVVSSAAFGLAALLASPASWAGPVAINSQTRSVHVEIPSIDDMVPDVNDTLTAPDNSPFNATLDRTLNQMGETNHALATQNSSFGNAGNAFSASGTGETRYSATGLPGIVFAESDFELQFTLAESRPYSVSGSGSFIDTGGGASVFAVILDGPGGSNVFSFQKSDFDPANGDGAVITPNFSTSGTLAPGAYKLTGRSGVSGGTNSNEVRASFDFDFSANVETDGGGGNPIPLPAAFGPGAVLFAGLVASSAYACRRRASC